MLPVALIAGLASKAADIVGKFVPDKDLAKKLNAELDVLYHKEVTTLIEKRADVLITEMSGTSLQRNWRPILMLTIVAIVANNYLIYPYLSLFWEAAPVLDLPKELWGLMKIGVGGYIVGRSAEKGIAKWKE